MLQSDVARAVKQNWFGALVRVADGGNWNVEEGASKEGGSMTSRLAEEGVEEKAEELKIPPVC